jgi:dolichol-phosphate mannosyltransferase
MPTACLRVFGRTAQGQSTIIRDGSLPLIDHLHSPTNGPELDDTNTAQANGQSVVYERSSRGPDWQGPRLVGTETLTARSDRVIVILPTFNEAQNIPILVPGLLAVGGQVDVLIVDDNSPDKTGRIADDLANRLGTRVSVLHRSSKSGRGGAVMAGMRQALADDRYAWFCEMDADLSHQAEELPAMLEAAPGFDMVVGSRYIPGGGIEGWGVVRRVWSRMSNRIIRTVLGVPLTDFTTGYRVYSRRAVQFLTKAELHETGYITLSEWAHALHKAGMSMREIPSVFVNRRFGKSNMSAAEAVGAIRALLRMRGWLPRR